MRELTLLPRLQHPNVCQLIGIAVDGGDIFIVTEWVARGDLRKLLYSEALLSWRLRCSFALDIAKAMHYLHAKSTLWRDCKSDNVLVTDSNVAKLCDFGTRVGCVDRKRDSSSLCLATGLARDVTGEKQQELRLPKKGPPPLLGTFSPTYRCMMGLGGREMDGKRCSFRFPDASRLSIAGTDEWMAPGFFLSLPFLSLLCSQSLAQRSLSARRMERPLTFFPTAFC